MDGQTLIKLKEILSKSERLGIAVGKNPTPDTMGAALALYLSLGNVGKKVIIASPNDPLVEVSSLVGINKVVKELDGEGGDLIVSFPYKTKENGESEIQKVSYTIEDGFLNIVVKAGQDGLSFSDKQVKYRRSGGVPQVLFVVGTPRLSDLGQLFDPQTLKDTTVVNIDNNPQNQQFGDVVLVSQGFSSVSEQVKQLISSLEFELTTDIAQNLLTGIVFATDNFQKPSSSALAFQAAADLLKLGAQRPRLNAPKPTPAQDGSFFPPVRMPNQGQNNASTGSAPAAGQQRKPFEPRQPDFVRQPKPQPQPQPFRPMPQFTQEPPMPPVPQPQANGQQFPGQGAPRMQEAPQPQKDNALPDAPPDWLTPKVYKGSTLV